MGNLNSNFSIKVFSFRLVLLATLALTFAKPQQVDAQSRLGRAFRTASKSSASKTVRSSTTARVSTPSKSGARAKSNATSSTTRSASRSSSLPTRTIAKTSTRRASPTKANRANVRGVTSSSPKGQSLRIRSAQTKNKQTNLTISQQKALLAKGRSGRQKKLKSIASDDKLGKADRGWIKQEINNRKRKGIKHIRNPPGKELAHDRGREAAKGYSYEHSKVKTRAGHKLQHKYDDNGKKNRERPVSNHPQKKSSVNKESVSNGNNRNQKSP